jgi:hypothetical protein
VSRAYRISLSESVRRHIKVEDGIKAGLEILEVLPREAMGELLKKELAGLGFEPEQGEEGEVMVRKEADGVVVSVDPKDFSVTVRVSKERDVAVEKEGSTRAYEEVLDQARERLRDRLKSELDEEVKSREDALRGELTATLERKLGDLRKELDRVSNRVVAEALKQKAASLGEIQEVSENEETGEVTIRVRV